MQCHDMNPKSRMILGSKKVDNRTLPSLSKSTRSPIRRHGPSKAQRWRDRQEHEARSEEESALQSFELGEYRREGAGKACGDSVNALFRLWALYVLE